MYLAGTKQKYAYSKTQVKAALRFWKHMYTWALVPDTRSCFKAGGHRYLDPLYCRDYTPQLGRVGTKGLLFMMLSPWTVLSPQS